MIFLIIVKLLFFISLVNFCVSHPVTTSSSAFRTNNERSGFYADTQRYAGNDERQMQRTSIYARSLGTSNVNVNGPILTSLSANNKQSGIDTNIPVDRKPTAFNERYELNPDRSPSRRYEYDRNKPEDTKYLNPDSRYKEESIRPRVRTSTESNDRITFDRNRFTEGLFLNSNERTVISKRPTIRTEPSYTDRSGITTSRSTEYIISNERSVFSVSRSSERTLSNMKEKSVINRQGFRIENPNLDRAVVTTKRSTEQIINNDRSGLDRSRSSDTINANLNDRLRVISSRPEQANNAQIRATTRRSAEDEKSANDRYNLTARRTGDIIFSDAPDRSGMIPNKPAEPLNNDRAGGKMRTSLIRQHGSNNNRSGLSVSGSTSNYERSESNINNPSKPHDIINYPKDSKDTGSKSVSFPDSNIQFHDNDTSVSKWRDTATVSTSHNRTNLSDRIYFTESSSTRSRTRSPILYPLTSTQKSDANNFPDPFEALANMNESTNSTVKPFSLLDNVTCPKGFSYDPEAKRCRKDIEDY